MKVNYSHHSLYVYNFTKYIQWPTVDNELVIGVAGGNPEIMEAFEKMAQTKSSPTFKLIIQKVLSPTAVTECHILYIPEAESGKAAIYAKKAGPNQLLITEGKDMLQKGGMINFIIIDKKLRFEINQDAFQKTRLKVSSQLLGMAHT